MDGSGEWLQVSTSRSRAPTLADGNDGFDDAKRISGEVAEPQTTTPPAGGVVLVDA